MKLSHGKWLRSVAISLVALFLLAGSALAVTTLSADIETDGNALVGGELSFTAAAGTTIGLSDANPFALPLLTIADGTGGIVFETDMFLDDVGIEIDLTPGSRRVFAITRSAGAASIGAWWGYPTDEGWIIYGPEVTDPANISSLKDGTSGTIHAGAYAARADGSTIPLLCASTRIEELSTNTVKEACFMADGTLDLGLATAGTDVTYAQTGVDKVSGSTETFAFTNTGAGVLNVTLDGSLAIGGGTAVTSHVAANLADGASGWVPDGIATSFTITASAASVTATSLIDVSVGANATATVCGVSTRTAATNFVVVCTAAPADGATLQYGITNF